MISSWAFEQGGILIMPGKHVTLEFGDFGCPTFATQQIKNTKYQKVSYKPIYHYF